MDRGSYMHLILRDTIRDTDRGARRSVLFVRWQGKLLCLVEFYKHIESHRGVMNKFESLWFCNRKLVSPSASFD